MVDVSNYVAQFGRNSGAGIPGAVDRGLNRGYRNRMVEQARPRFGTINPRDYTAESLAQYQQSGDFRDLQRYESQRSVNIGGVPHRFDPATGGWYPAEVTPGGGASGAGGDRRQITAEDVAKNEAERAAAVTKAQQEAKKQAELENPKAVQMRETGARLVRELLSPEMIESTKKLFGPLQGTDFARGMTFDPKVLDAKAKLEQLQDIATAENMGIMSGVLSESDLKVIGNIAGGGLVGRQSDEQAITNLEQLGQAFGGGQQQDQQNIPTRNAQGWQLMTDAQGNRAYVGPNGEIEEI